MCTPQGILIYGCNSLNAWYDLYSTKLTIFMKINTIVVSPLLLIQTIIKIKLKIYFSLFARFCVGAFKTVKAFIKVVNR